MASNSFGNIFKITTWGESQGKAIGVVIDGCPAGLEISETEINSELALRQPGNSAFTSPRKEKDRVEIFSGLFEGKTTGAPLSFLIQNQDADPSKYRPIKDLLRPGHANFTYLKKYGLIDDYGVGRSSARETACRVAAGAVAKKLLAHFDMRVIAYIKEIGKIRIDSPDLSNIDETRQIIRASPLFCPDSKKTAEMMHLLERVKEEGDSLGGIIEAVGFLSVGLGDPVYEKLEANLAKAMMSLPATKGFEIGEGFEAARMKGSEHNDLFDLNEKNEVITRSNHAGGTLGGISTGMPLVIRVAFKPTSSIKKIQETLTLNNEKALFQLPEGSRHDPCVTIRAVPIVEAMFALVLADALLLGRSAKLWNS